jgi:hypothetical protein
MPTLDVTKSYADGGILTEDMLDDIAESIETFFNTTKIDFANIQDLGVTTAKINDLAVTTAKIANDAVTTIKILDANVTRAKASATFFNGTYQAKAADYIMLSTDDGVYVDASGGARTITLFAVSGQTGKRITIKKIDSSTNAVTIDANSTETIDGATTTTLNTQYETVTLFCDGDEWHIENRTYPQVWTSYTPTVTGFGTAASVSFFYRRSGDSMQVMGRFVAGTSTAVEAQVTLPLSLTSDATKVASIRLCGPVAVGGNNAASYTALIESNVGYLTIGVQSAGSAGIDKANGNALAGSGEEVSIFATVPISGWNG